MAFRSTRLLHRLLFSGALALLLALGQQHAVLHWLSHALASVEAQKDVTAGPTDPACDECVGLAAFDASSPASTWAFAGTQVHDALVTALPPPGVATTLRLAFRSRAPPILS